MNLNTFEIAQNIRGKKFSKAEAAINFFITDVAENNASLAIPTSNDPMANKSIDVEELHYTFCNQFSSLISELFSSTSYKPSKETINIFLKYKFVIEWIFSASLWKNTDALIEHLGLIKVDAVGKIKLNKRNYLSLLMLTTLSSKYKLSWLELIKLDKYTTYIAYTCLLTQPIPALTKESNTGFNYLLESAKDFPLFELPTFEDLGKLNFPFFACSYATSPNKYEFKKWLTKLIRYNLPQWLSPTINKTIENMPDFQQKPKLKMAIMLEQYSPNHAMYRIYNRRFDSLKKDYELIAFIDESSTTDNLFEIFNKVITFEDAFNLNKNAGLVLQEKPDIIFYPSIGLNLWGIYLSQLRLAPKQLMMGGHPSSSFSPEIDCFLSNAPLHISEKLQPFFSEKVVTLNNIAHDTSGLTKHADVDEPFLEKYNQFIEDDQEIKIAINGILTKVNYSIIDVCKRIQNSTKKRVTFIFFSSYQSDSLASLSAKKQLSKMLKCIELAEFTDYKTYLTKISECHFLLPTLPFGSGNSNTDAALLNKPKLFLKGESHLYTYTDEITWNRLGLAEHLMCHSIEQLISKSVELIESREYRRTLHDKISSNCGFEKIYNQSKHTATSQLIKAAIMVK